jgi:hypothetical protein
MTELVASLRAEGEDLGAMAALEFFARDGSWHTTDYSREVKTLHAWEIEPSFEIALRRNLPEAEIRIGDSFELARQQEFQSMFNLIVLDNPMNTFGGNLEYCEHFEAIDAVKPLFDFSTTAFLIINVNSRPFNYDQFPDWKKRREEFYKLEDASRLSLDGLAHFYTERFTQSGFGTVASKVFHRDPRYLHYFLFKFSNCS